MNFHDRFCLYRGRVRSVFVALAAVIAVTGMANVSSAAILGNLGSSSFTYQYEMDVMPSTQDLDGNTVNDYAYFDFEGDITTPGDGNAHIVNPVLTPPQANSYVSGGTEANGIWATQFASGEYTIEFRAKVTQFTPGLLYDGFPVTAAMTVMANQSNGTSNRRGGGQVWLGDSFVDWGYQQTGNHLLSGIDNTTDFHTYRFVKKATVTNSGSPFEVWRDGVSLGSVVRATSNNTNFHYFGGATSGVAGEAQIDYLRIHAGAYAPAVITWNGSTDTDWAVGGNWDGGITPTNNVAILGTDQIQAPTANQPVLGGTDLVGGVNLNSGRGGWSISGAGTLTLGSGGIDATNSAHDGTNPITTYVADTVSVASIVLADDSTWTMGSDASYRKVSVSSVISGIRNLTVSGGTDPSSSGILDLTGTNTYTGRTNVSGGILQFTTIGNVGSGASNLGAPTTVEEGTITLSGGGALCYMGSTVSTDRVLNLSGTGGTVDASGSGAITFTSNLTATGVDSKTLTLRGTNTGGNTISGVIDNGTESGTTGVTKADAGKWILGGVNAYTGDTKVQGGILSITNSYLADAADVYLATGATLDLNFTAGSPDAIDSLFIDDVLQSNGVTWGATGSGAMRETSLITSTGVLLTGLLGDYSDNGIVDAADYVLWRKNPSDYGATGYDVWRANFGNGAPGSGSGLGDGFAVPEPGAGLLFVIAGLVALAARCRR